MSELLQKLFEILNPEIKKELELYIEASKYYYTEEPIMSDAQFDELSEKLILYNIPELTNFIKSTIYQETEETKGEMKIVSGNTQEMISLKKIVYKDRSSVSEIRQFLGRKTTLKKAPKLDGAALKITWNLSEEFPSKKIISRGGLNVTELFGDLPDILDTLKYNKTIIAGELVINKAIFMKKYSTETGGDYENPRNFVGSLLKQKNISQEIKNDIKFVPCTDGKNPLPNKVWVDINDKDLYNLEEDIKYYKNDSFPYLCDGIVLAYNEIGERKVKDNYPMNMLAIKFPSERAKSKVIDIVWSQKKSGKLTPSLVLEPVKLMGSTCSYANGYNYQNLVDNNIGVGSEIEIEKSGDIIPTVAKVLSYSINITLPKCGYKKEGKHLIALNLELSNQHKFFLAFRLLQIEGMGEVLIDKIGFIIDYDIIELFNPSYKPDICNILSGGANWKKFQEIYNIKNISLDMLISLLQFDGVGPKISLKIALLISKKSTDTSNIADNVLKNVARGEGFKKITESIKRLSNYGIKIILPMEINENTITFEMTGNPPGMTKNEFVKKIQSLYPNATHTTLTKETKYLFCEDLYANGGKMNKARKYNIKIISYSDALNNKIY
jgi:DNA ligase (NAD+)